MDDEKPISLGIFTIIFLTIALFFPVFILMDVYFKAYFLQSCFISFIIAFVIFYIFIWSRGSKQKGKREKVEDKKEGTSVEEIDKKKVELGKGSRASKTSLFDKIKGKKTCDTCGTELVYKEEMDSYYCPECHEYK